MNESSTATDPTATESSNQLPNAWDEVGEKLGALGLKLKYHAEQAAGEERTTFTTAMTSLSTAIDHAFEALRVAAKDPALKDDVKSVGSALSAAVSDTLSGVGSDVRKAFRRD